MSGIYDTSIFDVGIFDHAKFQESAEEYVECATVRLPADAVSAAVLMDTATVTAPVAIVGDVFDTGIFDTGIFDTPETRRAYDKATVILPTDTAQVRLRYGCTN